jgi:uncharacterized lipoprotein YajG
MLMMTARHTGLLLTLLCLAGCSAPVAAVRQTPQSVMLRWYQGEARNANAEQIADAYCGARRMAATLSAVDRNGSIEVATYRCR